MSRSVDELLSQVEALAAAVADGHFTLVRVADGWRALLGVPDAVCTHTFGLGQQEVHDLEPHPTPLAALEDLVAAYDDYPPTPLTGD